VTVHPPPLIFSDLRSFDAYLSGMEREYDAQSDGEMAQAGGYDRMIRVKACLQLLRDLRTKLAESLEAEEAERAYADSIEQQYKEAYGPDADKLAAYNAEGR
jgi:hypothetical protein